MSISSHVARNAIVGAALPILLAGIALTLVWSDLPDPVAIHWGPSGAADGFLDRSVGLVALTLGMPLLPWAALVAVTAAVPRSAPGSRVLRAIPSGLTWFVVTLSILPTVHQAVAGSQAPPLETWWLVAAVTAAIIGTAATAALTDPPPPLPARSADPDPSAPRLREAGGGALWWTGTAPTSTTMVVLAAVLVLAGLVLGWVLSPWLLLVLLPLAGLLAASSRAQVTIGRARVVVAGGLAGWPRLSVPLDTVVQAQVTTTGIVEWGGWGLRVRPGATGVITRAGEALELERTDGTRVVMTVDDAATAAAVVNTLLTRT